jgi:hypothetical protein
MAKPKKQGAPPKKQRNVNNQGSKPPQTVRVSVGEPWHVEIARIQAKTQGRIATFLTILLAILLTASLVNAWRIGDKQLTTSITQFLIQGLSVVIGWAFGNRSRKGG